MVDGGGGNDEIRASDGGNLPRCGGGDDLINAVNGELDESDCGSGKDKVLYDADLNVVENCEDRHPR